jgi:type III restriction enzyme
MLKNYQQDTLDALKLFLQRCASSKDVVSSYRQCIKENIGHEAVYNNPLANNNDGIFGTEKKIIPYVCLRLPTGGGKTVLAAHTVSIVCKEYLAKDFNLVLWLVPTNIILEQTYLTLQNKKHFYRQALDDAFEGKVEVMKVDDALHISKSNLQGQVNIIVSTIQTWRFDDKKSKESRKVYDNNGSLLHHFENLTLEIKQNLEHIDKENSALKHSLANVVYLNRPIIIIDEAHNARTPLTFDTIERLNPSCIVEYTATPKKEGKDRSNILYSVSAGALKSEDMIKMPIELLTTEDWQITITDAIKKQKVLEIIAKEEENLTGEYIRPIVLIQAEDDSQTSSTIDTKIIKEFLIANLEITENQVAIATGSERGIEGIDLNLNSCPIRFIITKQALKEGWDCPFAYIFCSVKDVKSGKDVEQLLGRVLRMPKVTRKQNEELNKAYAFVRSKSFYEVARNLADSLVECGFSEAEVSTFFVNDQQMPLLPFMGLLVRKMSETPKPSDIPREVREKIEINEKEKTITFKDKLTLNENDLLKGCFKKQEDKDIIEDVFKTINRIHLNSPQQEGKKLAVPQLLIDFEGELRIFDDDVLLPTNWNLAECNTVLSDTEFPVNVDSGTQGLIDLDYKGKPIIHTPRQIQEELSGLTVSSSMDYLALINWLDKECKHYSVPHSQNIVFIGKVIDTLIEIRKLHLEHLVYMRFKLRDSIGNKINNYVIDAKKTGFQSLFGFEGYVIPKDKISPFIVGQDFIFPQKYPVDNNYQGKFNLSHHYYQLIGDLNGEEEECAFNIDSNPNVEFWVRNIERKVDDSFWLQTSTDKFYPDFVVKLKNGTIVVVEYKGHDRYSNEDSKEKERLGLYWSYLTQGKCKFIMLNGKDWNALSRVLSI